MIAIMIYRLITEGTKQRVFQQGYFFEQVIRLVKVFWVAQQRFPLNSRIYEQVILSICGLVTLGIGSLLLPIS
ncbi:hypothetical protein AAFM79_14725 [Trichormus azollae HNT15244]